VCVHEFEAKANIVWAAEGEDPRGKSTVCIEVLGAGTCFCLPITISSLPLWDQILERKCRHVHMTVLKRGVWSWTSWLLSAESRHWLPIKTTMHNVEIE
jgi:hypothetical protein